MGKLQPDAGILEIKEFIEKTIKTYKGKRREKRLQKAWDMLLAISAEHKQALEEYSFFHRECLETIGILRKQIQTLSDELKTIQNEKIDDLTAKNDHLAVKNDQLDNELAGNA